MGYGGSREIGSIASEGHAMDIYMSLTNRLIGQASLENDAA